jgi:hypothetical protein
MSLERIDEVAQNKPTLVVRDLVQWGVPVDAAYSVLLRRGIFKWLACRRDFIRLKEVWKEREKVALELQRGTGGGGRMYWKGYRQALRECRGEVRRVCHSKRARVQDDDRHAARWLAAQGGGE